jgi:hypothetical protein
MTNETALERGRRRGWLALCAGVFLIVFVCAVWIWIDHIFASNGSAFSDASSMRLLGRLNVAFGLLEIAGLIGAINGWMMTRSGKPNIAMVVALVLFAGAAFITILQA